MFVTNTSDNYDEKYMEIKFNLDDYLPLNKKLELCIMTIAVKVVFHEGSKYYAHFFKK